MPAIGTESVAESARRLLEPVLVRDGYELVDVEWLRQGGWVLRLVVDRPGGVTIGDCQAVSRTVEPILDAEDLIQPSYSLEVSSPGLDRPLRKPEDFQRFSGQRAHIKTFAPVDSLSAPPRAAENGAAPAGGEGREIPPPGRAATPGAVLRKNWTGILRGFRDGAVEIEVEGCLHRISHAQIAKASLEYDFEADLQRKE